MPIIVGTELRYTSVGLEFDDTQLVNRALIAREGGTQQVVNDTTSQAAYLVHTHNRTDLLFQSDDGSRDYAGWVVYLSKDAELRFVSLEINPQRDDALWLQVLGREIGDRVQIVRRPPGGGDEIVRECFIRGISHDADLSVRSWRTTWALQAAEKFDAVFILDDAEMGVLDTSVLTF